MYFRDRVVRNRRERGAALVVAILVLAILTVIGIALMLITSTESRIAANEWSVNRAFYSADAGIRWATVEMTNPSGFLRREEFATGPVPPNKALNSAFGTILFQMPSFQHGGGKFFSGNLTGVVDPTGTDIQVRVMTPSLLGRRPYVGGKINLGDEKAQYMYAYEVRSNGGQNSGLLQYSRALVADVEMGPLPERLPF
jgi:type IV pilus assembly PilX-like protein